MESTTASTLAPTAAASSASSTGSAPGTRPTTPAAVGVEPDAGSKLKTLVGILRRYRLNPALPRVHSVHWASQDIVVRKKREREKEKERYEREEERERRQWLTRTIL